MLKPDTFNIKTFGWEKNFKKLLPLTVIVSLLSLTGCNGNLGFEKAPEKYSEVYFDYFDTVTNVIGYEKSEEDFLEKSQYVESELQRLDGLYDNYNSLPSGGVNLYYINQHAGTEPVEVDPDIIALFKEGKRIYENTNGKTNFAFGAVLEIWHNYREEALNDPSKTRVPSMEELTEASKHCNMDDVVIDEENFTVFYKDPLLKCDVGAIAKGYALERISEGLREMGAVNYTINAGGNVRSIGPKPDGGSWTVAIQNPDTEAEINYVEVLSINDMALTTSGSYQRFYTVDGVRYHHIINPDTLFPENEFLSVSILNKDAGMGDALSTALFNMSLEEGKALAESLDDTEVMWILADETKVYTDGFKDYIQK